MKTCANPVSVDAGALPDAIRFAPDDMMLLCCQCQIKIYFNARIVQIKLCINWKLLKEKIIFWGVLAVIDNVITFYD